MKFKILLLTVLLSITMVFTGSKSTEKMPTQSNPTIARNNSINLFPLLFNRAVDDLDSLFDMTDDLADGIIGVDTAYISDLIADSADITTLTSDTAYISDLVADSAAVTSLRDDAGRRFLGVTEKYSITVVADFDTSEDNETEQGIVIDSLPVLARLMDAWAICTDSVLDEIDSSNWPMSLVIGTSSGDNSIMAAADVDADDEVGAMTTTEIYDLAPQNAKQAVFLSGTPDTNWIYLERGSWDIYLQYIDNESY